MSIDHETPFETIPVIDCDVHRTLFPTSDSMRDFLPKRWRDYIETYGLRGMWMTGERPYQRRFAARTDAWGPEGQYPGTDPDFVRAQHLDAYDYSGALMNEGIGTLVNGGRQCPDELCVALCRAFNDYGRETWLASDSRWYSGISVAYEVEGAAEEIRRCREDMGDYSHRWSHVLLAADNERPMGNKRYWPIFEACEHFDIPVGFHVFANRSFAGTGTPDYYFEEHTLFANHNWQNVASFIFSGVFDRFPRLKVALFEFAWSWAVPFGWRLDRSYGLISDEGPKLERRPSEYLADHFWFTSQPMEEPEHLDWFDDVYALFSETLGHKLMYSSDYPHWDFEEPVNVPITLPAGVRRKILGENASELFGIPLREGTGLKIELAGV